MLSSHNSLKKLSGYSKVMIKLADVLMAYCMSAINPSSLQILNRMLNFSQKNNKFHTKSVIDDNIDKLSLEI